MEYITGIIDRIRFYNVRSGYIILKLIDEKEEPIVVVGETSMTLYPGQTISAEGYYNDHAEFGHQFVAQTTLVAHLPKTTDGLKKLLASGFIKGIGKVWGIKLVDYFGVEIIQHMKHNPDKLMEMPGVSTKKHKQWIEAIKKNFAALEVSAYLASLGLGPMRTQSLLQKYGGGIVDIIRDNPYQLYQDNRGFGFRLVDNIALHNGIQPNSIERLRAGIQYVLEEAALSGHCYMVHDGMIEKLNELLGYDVTMDALLTAVKNHSYIVTKDQKIALLTLIKAEVLVSENIQRLLSKSIPSHHIQKCREALGVFLLDDNMLSQEQIQAIHSAISEPVTVITGGPGVGKTTVIRAILRTFEMSGKKVLLAAPTGRAAKRLKESTGRAAVTIHRLLKYDPTQGTFVYNAKKRISADVVILDEVSMVDIVLMGHVMSALATGCRFIMVGDRDQLPSVGPGSVLADIIQSQCVTVASLTHIFRQARFSKIIQTAHQIRHGYMPVHHPESDCIWLQCTDSPAMLSALRGLYTSDLIQGWDPIKDVQILTAMHRGQVGTKHLNTILKEQLNPSQTHYALGDKIIQLRNNYDKEVFNGDVGIIQKVTEQGIIVEMDDGRHVHYLDDETSDIQLAYATTIHKSQGSEYPVVVVMIATEQFMLLNRYLLYTAVTRARKRLILIASPKAVAIAVKNDDPGLRRTQLTEALSALSIAHHV